MLKCLIVLGIIAIPFTTSDHLNSTDDVTVSFDQFTALNQIGRGSFGVIYVVRKNGGSDDGKLYAMKTVNITHALEYGGSTKMIDFLNSECEILEAVEGLSYATGLHYAFRHGELLFFIMDLVTGGNVFDRLRDKKPTNATAKLILAEIVSIVEKLHSHDIIHGDLNFKNILIDNDGHFVFTDFGYASKRIDNNSSRRDWSRLALICYNVFPDNDKTHKILKHAMKNMTDEELPEFKKHPFFDGVDWEQVAKRASIPSYEPNDLQIDYDNAKELVELFQISEDDEENLDADLVDKFQYFSFVALQHRN